VLRLHLTDQQSGLERVLEALGGPAS
jgi:hypothetical protein